MTDIQWKRMGIDDSADFARLMAKLEKVAVERYDGHFTVLRFTTNWRVCFYTPGRGQFKHMAVGKTFQEAAEAALAFEDKNPKGWYDRIEP